MLGLGDFWVSLAYVLCILSSLLCIGYGVANWNKGDARPDEEDKHWAEEEEKIESEL